MIKTETYKLSLLPEQKKVLISQRNSEAAEWDTIIMTGKDWRKGEFHRVYVTVHFPKTISTKARDLDIGHYTLCDPRDEIEKDTELEYDTLFLDETIEAMKRDIVAIIGALRGIA